MSASVSAVARRFIAGSGEVAAFERRSSSSITCSVKIAFTMYELIDEFWRQRNEAPDAARRLAVHGRVMTSGEVFAAQMGSAEIERRIARQRDAPALENRRDMARRCKRTTCSGS